MPNKMIVDASHPEETRVVVLRGNRVEEFDFESASKRPLRGNIYLAKVTRVEPSLQAAFVDYGGNRHGFLAFSEIHPDYYQIPVADRQALLEEEARSHGEDDEEPTGERRSRRHRRPRAVEAEARLSDEDTLSEAASAPEPEADLTAGRSPDAPDGDAAEAPAPHGSDAHRVAETSTAEVDGIHSKPDSPSSPPPVESGEGSESSTHEQPLDQAGRDPLDGREPDASPSSRAHSDGPETASEARSVTDPPAHSERYGDESPADEGRQDEDHEVTTLDGGSEESQRIRKGRSDEEGEPVEQIGGDALEEVPRRQQRFRRPYKIQEVIKRRQVLLVQVVKEERGNKGAALTTYLSLAGRYSVLMPNTARGGGISRKITNAQDRSRLKSIAEELDVPEGMGVILRTAGATRTKAEVKRDFEYLLRMWETVRETTLASSAPMLVYEEGSLIKRAIRDLYSKEVDEIVVAGETGYREARDFMRLLMPSHVSAVQPYRDTQPVFAKAGVESQLDALFSNQVTLRSGGYIVINQTEALVAIDVNSGRSTREHNIEDTALRTNLEAADEIARQLRLRDLAGLIVVDFIDMEEARNNRSVERRIKDALKNDRARIQVGRISHFGLLEMSRQRIRTGVLEGSTVVCAHCQGAGVVRSTASIALHVLRVLEDALIKSATHDVIIRTRTAVALYILNHKRLNLRDLERRFGVNVAVEADDALTGANYHAIERGEPATGVKQSLEPPPLAQDDFVTIAEEPPAVEAGSDDEQVSALQDDAYSPVETGEDEPQAYSERDDASEDSDGGRRRRRRRRRRGGERSLADSISADAPQPTDDGLAVVAEIGGDLAAPVAPNRSSDRGSNGESGRARRSRRGRGRSRFGSREDNPPESNEEAVDQTGGESPSAYEALNENPDGLARESAIESVATAAPWTGSPEMREAMPPVDAVVAKSSAPEAPTSPPPEIEAEESRPAAPAPEAAAADESPRPRRGGWWQRARATIVGN